VRIPGELPIERGLRRAPADGYPLRLTGKARAAIGDRRGNALVQFALVLPAFVMLIFGIIEIGRGLWLQNALHYATEQAARCASVNPTACTAGNIGSYAASVSGANIPASSFTLTTPACGNQVDGTYRISLAIPFKSMSWSLTARSCFPK
jgi:Flp pilus assembly protein TadG